MQDVIKQIRIRLRLSMNGIVSTSMREKGLNYKLNFGVSIPKLKEIAKETPPSASLAEALWEQDVREMKILATMLYPLDEFTEDKAHKWASDIIYPEIAEQYVMNLLQHHPKAEKLSQEWLTADSAILQLTAYLLLARLFMKNRAVDPDCGTLFLTKAKERLDESCPPSLSYPIINALKRYGVQSVRQAESVLNQFSDYNTESAQPEKQNIYEELKLEFDYYL